MQIAEFGQKHIFTTEGGVEVVVTELAKDFAKDNHICFQLCTACLIINMFACNNQVIQFGLIRFNSSGRA